MDGIAGIIVFFVIISLLDKVAKASKSKNNAPGKPASGQPVQRMPDPAKSAAPRPANTAAAPAKAAAPEIRRAIRATATQMIDEAGEPDVEALIRAAKRLKTRAAQPREKTSIEKDVEARNLAADSEGCIGGSIAHTQHEGESKAEHAEHMLRTIRPAAQTAQPAVSIPQLRTADLRKAVVMSEILDKPVSMRGRKAV